MPATTTGLTFLNIFKEPLFNVSKDLKDEFLHVFDNGLPEYIDNFYDKYSKTKTFIYRDEKVNFYDIYFPVTLKSNSETFDSITDLNKLFCKRNFITIIGSAGSGKSMLMKHIFLSTINQSYKIPIVIELRNLTDYEGNIHDYVVKILTRNQLGKNPKIVDRILKEGNFIFLFDGYDEIYSSAKNRITNDIEEFVDSYSKNIFVVTSRPGSNAESLQRFDNFYTQPLDSVKMEEFIKQQFKFHENQESVDRIISVIKKPENRDYKDYLANPLLLSMFIFTFNAYPELPKHKNKFYWNVFDTLCTKHDSFTKKGFWLHERKSNLLNDDLENILKWFSYLTIFRGKYNFDQTFLKNSLADIISKLNLSCNSEDLIYDLTVSISIIIQDGTEYTFPHKSLQEYFTASLIRGLNDSQKQKIYNEKFNQLEDYSTGGKINFYKLCHEMDKVYFSKFFLIPRTELFLKRIDASSEREIVKSYFKVFSPLFLIDREYSISAYTQDFYVEDSFLAFYNIQDFLPSFEVLNDNVNVFLPYIKIQENKTQMTLKTSKLIAKPEFEKFISNSGIDKKVIEMHQILIKNFEILKNEVQKENEDTEQLLDI